MFPVEQSDTQIYEIATRETAANALRRTLHCSETKAYELIRSGEVETFSVGRKTFLLPGAIERFIQRGGSRKVAA